MAAFDGAELLIQVSGVTKRFGGVLALRGVDFDLRASEIHALLGENGAGKSTLIKVLAGIHTPDSGRIRVRGRDGAIRSVSAASALGIRVIHQELSLSPNLTVAENIFLGVEPCRGWWISRRRMVDEARKLVDSLGLTEISDVHRPVRCLSIAHRQLVEIARALSQEARILILDEPTSALSDAETEALFSTLRRLREAGVGMIYISHRLDEILRIADRITVLRDGSSIGVRAARDVDRRELIRWMVDRDIGDHYARPSTQFGEVLLEVQSLCSPGVQGVNLTLRSGEILGIAGLVGSGRSELARALFGIDPHSSGRILVDRQEVTIRGPQDALRAGLVLVPEDRAREGLIMVQTLAFNLALPWTSLWCRGVTPNYGRRAELVDRAIESFRIKAASPDVCVAALSGGNQQKAVVGRWMERKPKVLILDEPTRGVDVGAREEMFSILSSLVAQGMGVLLISSDLAEVLSVSHRVLLYRDGSVLGEVDPRQVSMEDIMARLTGAASRGGQS